MVATNIALTYIGSPGDGGDQYAGLDRFGRIIQLRWDDTNSATDAVNIKYVYDRNGNRLFAENELDNDFDELYMADSGAYDGLNQLTEFQRGQLSGGNTQITAQTRRQTCRVQKCCRTQIEIVNQDDARSCCCKCHRSRATVTVSLDWNFASAHGATPRLARPNETSNSLTRPSASNSSANHPNACDTQSCPWPRRD